MNLEHANITVKSVDDAVKFLELVFPESRIRGGGELQSGGRWIHFGDDQCYLALQENAEHSGRQDVTYSHDGINHLGFEVTNLDAIIARLKSHGFEMSPMSAMAAHPNRRRAYFFDGNDVEWELVEYLAESPHERNDYDR